MDGKNIVCPNPNWEDDLEKTVVIGPDDSARVESYSRSVLKPKKLLDCHCKASHSTGVAPKLKFNDGREIPALGLGTWLGFTREGGRVPVKGDEVEKAVEWAIDAGYRHIDTAAIYNTEPQVGRAVNKKIAEGVIKREDIFITTKLWNTHHAEDEVVPALQESLAQLNLTYVDLYLIHWPISLTADGSLDSKDYVDTWRGMQRAREHGLARSIGVSNFNVQQLDRLTALTNVTPASLQVEINLNLQQPELLAYCKQHGILVTGYTPFGSILPSKAADDAPPPRIDHPALVEIANKYNKTVPQIVLRYEQPEFLAYCKQHGILVTGYTPFGFILPSKAADDAPPPRIDHPALVEIANKYNKTVPQIVLRYEVELGVLPIPKSTTKSRIEQNIDIFDFELTQQERDVLKAFDKNYRTIPVKNWKDSAFYPFEKN